MNANKENKRNATLLIKIYGSVRKEEGKRIRYNRELYQLPAGKDLVDYIKSFGKQNNVVRMNNEQVLKKVLK